MDERTRELERRAREGDLLAACALERELARAGGRRSFDARGLLAVLREDGREVLLAFGDVTLAARRRGERAVLRASSRSPEGPGLPAQFTAWLSAGWTDESFVQVAGKLYAQAVRASEDLSRKKSAPAPAPAPAPLVHSLPERVRREASQRSERERRARQLRHEERRGRFLRRVLG